MSGHSRQRVRHPWLVVALLFASTAGALWLFFTGRGAPALGMALLFVPETSGDRERILRALELPERFEFLAIRRLGNRSGIAGSPAPSTTADYSAPWDEGKLCTAVEELARESSSAPIQRLPSSAFACSFAGTIPSGWWPRVLNEWHYDMVFKVRRPGSPSYGRAGHRERLPPDRTWVSLQLFGKQGW